MTKIHSLLLVCASSIALSACSTSVVQNADMEIDRRSAEAQELAKGFDNIQTKTGPTNLSVNDGLYLGNQGMRIRTGDDLPARFEGQNGVVLGASTRVNIIAFAEMVQKATGIRVNYADLMNSPLAAAGDTQFSGVDATMLQSAYPNSPYTDNASVTANPTEKTFHVEYSGPLSGILDRVAANIGSDWRYEDGTIKFLGPRTQHYSIALNSSIHSTSSSVSSTTSQLSVDYWSDFLDGLEAAIPDKNARFSVNRSTGSITVTGTDATHERVARYVASENDRVSRQVAVTVDIVSYTSSDTSNKSSEVTSLLKGVLDNGASFAFGGPAGIDALGPRLTANILNGNLAGTETVLEALNKRGRASLLNSTSVVALNNMPTPVKVARETSYVANVTTTTDDDGGTSTDLIASTVDSGLDMVITPRILGDGDIFLNVAGKLTDIIDISEFSSAGSQVQLPVTSISEMMQAVEVENGQTMLIASTSREKTDRDLQGPFNPRAWGLGGRSTAAVENTQIFILVRPQIVDSDTRKGLFR